MSTNKHIKEVAIKKEDLYRSEPSYPNKILPMSLGIPQSVNHMYINTRGGGRTLTSTAKKYVNDTRAKINEYIEREMWKIQNNSTWYYLDMIIYMPDRRTRDSHNMLKLLLDVMEGFAFINDYYIMPNIRSVEYDKDNPRVDLILRPQLEMERQKELKRFNKVIY